MNEIHEVICIVCPLGCPIEVELADGRVLGTGGHECKRGKEYALDEVLSPARTVTTTVRIRGGILPLVPVRTPTPIPKARIPGVLRELAGLQLDAPIAYHQVILDASSEDGVQVIATRMLPALCE